MKRKRMGPAPLFQPLIQDAVVCLQHNHQVEPPLREEVAAVVVHYVATQRELVLQGIAHLRPWCVIWHATFAKQESGKSQSLGSSVRSKARAQGFASTGWLHEEQITLTASWQYVSLYPYQKIVLVAVHKTKQQKAHLVLVDDVALKLLVPATV